MSEITLSLVGEAAEFVQTIAQKRALSLEDVMKRVVAWYLFLDQENPKVIEVWEPATQDSAPELKHSIPAAVFLG